MKPIDYLHDQLALEGIRIAGDGLIGRLSEDVLDFPLMILARTCDAQNRLCIDDELPHDLRSSLLECRPQPSRLDPCTKVLRGAGIATNVERYRTYVFPEVAPRPNMPQVKCLRSDDPMVAAFRMGGLGERVFAIEDGEAILSACVSSRQNGRCAEAWVMTRPAYRRQGFAGMVVAAWAAAMQADGILPFYSHELENAGSAGVAKSLGLLEVFTETVVERAI